MAEWQHNCTGAGRLLLIPRGELCDRCGRDEIDAYAERGRRVLERLGLPVPPKSSADVSGVKTPERSGSATSATTRK